MVCARASVLNKLSLHKFFLVEVFLVALQIFSCRCQHFQEKRMDGNKKKIAQICRERAWKIESKYFVITRSEGFDDLDLWND